jgi:hypothetical protein
MAINRLGDEPGSSGYWLRRLGAKLDARARGLTIYSDGTERRPAEGLSMKVYDQYYRGIQPLAFSSDKYRAAFGDRLRASAENICGVVVDTLIERLEVRGFRMPVEEDEVGTAERPPNEPGDREAWRIWQANGLDGVMRQGFRTAAVKGEANLLVGPGIDEVTPAITIEDPLETIVVTNRGRRVVALKRWLDVEIGKWRAFVYYPDRIEKFTSVQQLDWFSYVPEHMVEATMQWEPQAIPGEDQVLIHDLDVVPMIPLVNKPNLTGAGESELAPIVPIQDEINKLVADMIIASEYGAFRQKWAIGIDVPRDPQTGEPIPGWVASVAQMWAIGVKDDYDKSTDPDPQVGQFEITPLTSYLEAIKQRLQMAATISRMPPHYLLGDPGQWPSGESLTAAESGLVAKANDRTLDHGEAIEEAMRVGFLVVGDERRARALGMETIWKDPRFRSEAEHVDAVVKKKALDVPNDILLEELYSPQQIERIQAARRRLARELTSADPLLAEAEIELLVQRAEVMQRLRSTGATFESAAVQAGLPDLVPSGLEPVTVSEQGEYE